MKRTIIILNLLFAGCLSLFAQGVPEAFYGNWILEPYVDAIDSKASAFENEAQMGFLQELVIQPEFDGKVLVSFYNLEGDYFPLTRIDDQTLSFSLGDESGSATYKLSLDGTGERKKIICKADNYTESFLFYPRETDSHSSIETLLNDKLFAGNYHARFPDMMAARSEGLTVNFNPNGSVDGIEGFDRYFILANFDDIAEFDVVKLLNSQTQAFEWFGWEIQDGDLVLFTLMEGEVFLYRKAAEFMRLRAK